MTRDERARQLNRIRQTDPKRLIRVYRAATNTDQLPRGLGFIGMIEAILQREFEAMTQEVTVTSGESISQRTTTASIEQAVQQRPFIFMGELTAFVTAEAMVATGLLMAVVYLFVTNQMSGA
jgi:hypothetical protein